jgi:predicted AlkP superfamily phosphohydrolase/phosphomutase
MSGLMEVEMVRYGGVSVIDHVTEVKLMFKDADGEEYVVRVSPNDEVAGHTAESIDIMLKYPDHEISVFESIVTRRTGR